MNIRYFEYHDEKSDKFWQVERTGSYSRVTWGKCSSSGKFNEAGFDTEEEATKACEALLTKKLKEGYVEMVHSKTFPTGAYTVDASWSAPMRLYMACTTGDLAAAQQAVQDGASVNLMLADYSDYYSMLVCAIKAKHQAIAEYLLTIGTDVQAAGKDGQSALWYAADRGCVELIPQLLKKGADINLPFYTTSPLTASLRSGHMDIFDLLLSAGADLVIDGPVCLDVAVGLGNIHAATKLLDAGVPVNGGRDSDVTPLVRAVLEGKPALVDLLLQRSALVDGLCRKEVVFFALGDKILLNNATPLDIALAKGSEGLVKKLLAAGATVEARHLGLVRTGTKHTEALLKLIGL